jgi:hydrogenase/urease accessory protein HupE
MLSAIAWITTQAPTSPPDDSPPIRAPEQITPGDAIGRVQAGGLHTVSENVLTLSIFIFGFVALYVLYLLARNERASPFVLRIYVITILIFGSLLVVANAYTTNQLAPVMGLFGTIAGYVLGRGDRPNEPR